VAEFATPKRTSLPSIAAPTACGTVALPDSSKTLVSTTLANASTPITARMAWPCRTWPTSRPKVRGSANGISRMSRISNQFVQAVGFSNGWAELAL
jgi:hypothetical protein